MADHKNILGKSMAYHKKEGASESEQMYLVTGVILEEEGATSPIPLSALAHELGVQPVSAHQMVRKLDEDGLASYIPYKGMELTTTGKRLAAQVLRNRRLWEVFLVERLNLPFEEAHSFACMMEHITSPEIAVRLAKFLGAPLVNPQGKLIPSVDNEGDSLTCFPLSQLAIPQEFQVVRVEASETERLFLKNEGIYPGAVRRVSSVGSQGTYLLEGSSGGVYISAELADAIIVRKLEINSP
jgi:DtxR family transcriptional regulator, Mn-dependent transcriptional regulator